MPKFKVTTIHTSGQIGEREVEALDETHACLVVVSGKPYYNTVFATRIDLPPLDTTSTAHVDRGDGAPRSKSIGRLHVDLKIDDAAIQKLIADIRGDSLHYESQPDGTVTAVDPAEYARERTTNIYFTSGHADALRPDMCDRRFWPIPNHRADFEEWYRKKHCLAFSDRLPRRGERYTVDLCQYAWEFWQAARGLK